MNKILLMLSAAALTLSPVFAGQATIAPQGKVSEEKKKEEDKAEKKKEEDKVASEEVAPSPAKPIPPTLKINGFTLFNTYFSKQSNKSNGKGGAPLHFATDVSDLYFTVAGRAQGIDYMYRVNIQTYPGSSPTIDKNYIEIKTENYGFRMGSTVGPEDFGIHDAGRVIGGAGGFESASYVNAYNLSAGIIKGNDNIGDTGNAAKIVFLGPDYRGLQFFVAYTPNTSKGGDAEKNNHYPDNPSLPGNGSKGIYPDKQVQPYGMNNWSFAVNYKYAQGPFNMILTAAGVKETSFLTVPTSGADQKILRARLRDNFVYQLGGVFGYDKWQLGLGYLNNRKARLPKAANMALRADGTLTTGNMHLGNSGQAMNAGIGYTKGAWKFAGSYHRFWRKTDANQKASNDVWTGTVDLNIFQGWKMYVELDYIKSKTNQTMVDFVTAVNRRYGSKAYAPGIGNNRGVVGIVGTKISF